MTITNISVFRSTDGGAVSGVNGRCSGTAGDGVALLNQLLINGYNWQEVTRTNLTNAGSTGTLVLTAHGFNIDQRLWLVGMDQAGYKNGTTHGDALYPLTVADANTLTFTTTGSPTSPSTTDGGAGGTTTTLNGALSDTTGTTVVATNGITHYPGATSFVIKIDTEYMLVTAGMGTNTWTVVRGFGRSTAATHSNSATITQVILIGVAPAGGFAHWTADFTASNKSTYRPSAGNRFYIDADDNTSAQNIELRGYETMTAVATGTGQFPTTTQLAVAATTGFNFLKSTVASTTARAWVAIATDRSLILWNDCAGTAPSTTANSYIIFCDLNDLTHSGDAYHTLFIAYDGTSSAGVVANNSIAGQSLTTVNLGHYMARSYTQIGTSVQVNKFGTDFRGAGQVYSGATGGMTYPHPPDGGLYVCKFTVNEGSAAINRGTIPGLWNIMHSRPATHLDTWTGTGAFAGKKFMAVTCYNAAQIALEISNTIPTA
jgi:hypothetical protein